MRTGRAFGTACSAVARATTALALLATTMQATSVSASAQGDGTDFSSQDDCSVLETVLIEHLKINSQSRLPLRTDVGSSPPMSADTNDGDSFVIARINDLLKHLPTDDQTEMKERLRAGFPHQYRITCHWTAVSIPAEPKPERRWCDVIPSPIPAKPSGSPAEIALAEAAIAADAKRTCPFPGGISLGRPVMNAAHTWALVDTGVELMPLDGEGSICLLNKTAARWRVVQCLPTWVS